jgi:small basic protein
LKISSDHLSPKLVIAAKSRGGGLLRASRAEADLLYKKYVFISGFAKMRK